MGGEFDVAVALARALVFVFALQAVGALLFLARLPADRAAMAVVVRRLAVWSAGIALCSVVLRSIVEPMRMAGSLAGAADPLLVRFFWESNVGLAQIVRLAGLGIGLGSCFARPATRKLGAWVATALVVVSFALMGHTRTHDDGILGALLAIHLLAAAYWFGALLPLHVALSREFGASLIAMIGDFSRWAVWLVPAMLVVGGTIAWRLLGSWGALASPYGVLLLVKLSGFGVLVALGAFNRYRLVPALSRRPQAAAAVFRRVIRIELAIMVAVLLATAAMTTLYSPESP